MLYKRTLLTLSFLLMSQASFGADAIRSLTLPFSDLELSTTKTHKIAKIELESGRSFLVKRCHQYRATVKGLSFSDFIVCRDAYHEILMDGTYGSTNRFARVRRAKLADQFFACEQKEEHDLFKDAYGSIKVFKCTPTKKTPPAFALLDKEPVIVGKYPTQNASTYLPTLWAKSKPQDWDHDWAPKLAEVLPYGTYEGAMSTLKKKCTVTLKNQNGRVTVEIASGTRTVAGIELNEENTLGATYQQGVEMDSGFTGKMHKGNVFLASAETPTDTPKYSSRNLMVATYPDDGSRHLDVGKPAVFVGGTYCRRLVKQ